MSLVAFLTEDAKEECKRVLNSKDYYLATDGSFAFSASNDIIDLVLAHMTA
jgi:hypothetical protein